ncbi:UvrD/REP helicase N-terminal domain-containing protein [Thermomonospora echinospora]|uniref:UvrD/REP helicase N-terminal domain-containing protein n=1 Tax=Thermomonospora echinospora TaxID=1992 RepID=A0A1H6EB17_9ACTN|nr:UvrD-helicase domain-containing protein [Thermomonospora echinospora]SEG94124.1 UvrD/REP helicase N-terminal domain-containing protein [Thermomonospora echinospora]
MNMTDRAVLTAEQLKIAQQPWEARTLVTAEAGSGKTFCLIHRLVYLVEEEGLEAADLLVLSFSRAAVREIRDRLAVHGGYAQDVDVRTFDSYATWVLAETDPDGSWQSTDYDGRIRAATDLIRKSEDASDLLKDLRHVVVDEVQDLVEERADLVKAVMEKVDGGFTLLGDPAQGIYSFQIKNREERIRGAAALYEWIRGAYDGDLIEASLTENFRARTAEAQVARAFGPPLGLPDADYRAIQRNLRTELLAHEGGYLGSLTDAVPVLQEVTSPTAVLCRNNGEALLISREFHRHGVSHRLQRAAQDRVIPKWVAEIFLRFDWPRPSRADVMNLLESTRLGDELTADLAWDLIKRVDGSPHNRAALDLNAVRRNLARGTVPDELVRQAQTNLVVSTIHRVKGLEFDQVVVVDPGDASDDPVDQAESARTLYVAMTRPRDRLLWVKPVSSLSKAHLKQIADDRWAECGYGKYRNSRFGMEVRGSDVHSEDPAGTLGYLSDPERIQSYLFEKVPDGAPVSLIRLDESDHQAPPRYAIQHEGIHIGITSESFGWALHRTLKVGPKWRVRRWPQRIEYVRVDSVETIVGSEAAGANAGLGEFGVWLRPRINGLGGFVWGDKERA